MSEYDITKLPLADLGKEFYELINPEIKLRKRLRKVCRYDVSLISKDAKVYYDVTLDTATLSWRTLRRIRHSEYTFSWAYASGDVMHIVVRRKELTDVFNEESVIKVHKKRGIENESKDKGQQGNK